MTAIQYLDEPADGYRPGACNIGPAEISRRRRSGYLGLGVAAALAVGLVVTDAAPVLRLAVGAPLFVGLLGFAQAQLRFCVGFATMGLRNFGALGGESKVGDRAAHRADLRRATVITAGCAAAAGAVAVGFALLPL